MVMVEAEHLERSDGALKRRSFDVGQFSPLSQGQRQAVCAVGMFELQIRHFQNPQGVLQSGECCDLQATGGQRCSLGDQCDTYFKACLKEYQVRVVPTGACTFGVGSTTVLGGNTQSLRHRGHDEGGGGDGTTGHIVIPFKYAWPTEREEEEEEEEEEGRNGG
ncbi:unnamed protein product [Coregonus sp. 'balchen']|nr:unnamed protein product [Coregonus sp. 'balchen']